VRVKVEVVARVAVTAARRRGKDGHGGHGSVRGSFRGQGHVEGAEDRQDVRQLRAGVASLELAEPLSAHPSALRELFLRPALGRPSGTYERSQTAYGPNVVRHSRLLPTLLTPNGYFIL
jgi:hypothetical protein